MRYAFVFFCLSSGLSSSIFEAPGGDVKQPQNCTGFKQKDRNHNLRLFHTRLNTKPEERFTKDEILLDYSSFDCMLKVAGTGNAMRSNNTLLRRQIEALGKMSNAENMKKAKGNSPQSDKRELEKKSAQRRGISLRKMAKTLFDNNTPAQKLVETKPLDFFSKRASKSDLVNQTYKFTSGSKVQFKVPLALKTKLGNANTLLFYQYNEGQGKDQDENRYKVKSELVGLEFLDQNGDKVPINELNETQKISIRFPNVKKTTLGVCGWYNETQGEWSEAGCERSLNPFNESHLGAECKCNHLTEFAIIEPVAAAATTNTTSKEGWTSGDTTAVAVGSVVVLTLVYFAWFDMV